MADFAARRQGGTGTGGTGGTAGRKVSAETRAAKPAVGRSASTLRHLLKEAEKDLAKLARQREKLAEQLVSAGNDHTELARVGTELAAVDAAIAAAEERWLEVAAEAEA